MCIISLNFRVSLFCKLVAVWMVLPIFIGILAPAVSVAQQATHPPIQVKTLDIPYVLDGNANQDLRVYVPEDIEESLPTFFMIHGGAFRFANKTLYDTLARHLVERGYAVISINYRLLPRFTYPTQVQDAFCALAWTHANADTYGFDPERIIAFGDSAGATLAAMLGTVDDTSLYMEGCTHRLPETDLIQGVIAFYGVFDLSYNPGEFFSYLGKEFSEAPDLWAEASPIHWIDGSEPPFLLIHGTKDTMVPVSQSKNFAAALKKAKMDVELVLIPEVDHLFITHNQLSSSENVQSLEAMDTFLSKLFEE